MRTLKALTVAAALAVLAAGPAVAQQPRSDQGTNANGPITILKNMQPEPDGVQVQINGAQIDDLKTADYADITGDVHAGQNVLTVSWSGPLQKLNFKVAYAATRNNFRNVLVVNMNGSNDNSLHQAGAKTISFTIPR